MYIYIYIYLSMFFHANYASDTVSTLYHRQTWRIKEPPAAHTTALIDTGEGPFERHVHLSTEIFSLMPIVVS
jgi:hypothetical protein